MFTLGLEHRINYIEKSVILEDGKRLSQRLLELEGLVQLVQKEVIAEIMKVSGLNEFDISCSVVTGYGRNKYEGL